TPRLLVVEDEVKVAHALREGLTAADYAVVLCLDGEHGLRAVQEQAFDGAVLDLMLPGRGGIEILAALRARPTPARVPLLTARDTSGHRGPGPAAGADASLVSPSASADLLARLRALLRRARKPQRLVVGDLAIEPATHAVTRAGRAI